MNLEPEGEPELSFSQRMLLNKAHAFITKRMERRQRVHSQKRSKKLMMKLSKMISNKLMFGNGDSALGHQTPDGDVQYHGSVMLPPGFTFGQSSPENPIHLAAPLDAAAQHAIHAAMTQKKDLNPTPPKAHHTKIPAASE